MRIKQIWVRGLFGLFDYDIALNLDERVTIIIGPNGSGKTTLLSMLNGLLTGGYFAWSSLPFAEFGVVFNNGSRLKVARLDAGAEDDESEQAADSLEFSYETGPDRKSFKRPKSARAFRRLSPSVLRQLTEHAPWLSRVGPDTWVDERIGRHLSFAQVRDLYGDALLSDPKSQAEWFIELGKASTVRFIGTKRLEAPRQIGEPWGMVDDEGATDGASAVGRYSKHVAQAIRSTLAEYAELSQRLDRTFPTRLVERSPQADLPEAELRRRLEELESKRSRLVEAGLLDEDRATQFPLGPSKDVVDDKTRSVLSVYVTDYAEKLAVFDGIAARIDLLKGVVNKRFSHKQLRIDKETGFRITTDKGGPLTSDDLSSGEQHELVLLSEFLFETKRDSLILIDEPEISLHVAWQREFLKDISEIAKLVGFDALIATHSPQIIADRWDLKVELEEKPVAQPNPE